MRAGKRRFGVALSSDIADELDSIVKDFNVNRSAVIEHAVRGFITEFTHYRRPHRCTGVLLLFDRGHGTTSTTEFIDKYKDLILAYTHHHVGNHCVEVLIVSGESEVIEGLHKKVLERGCRCRYVPLEYG